MIIVKIGIVCLNIVYAIFKLFPTKHKVVFLSRQYNAPSADFLLVEKELKKEDPTIKTKMLCKMLDGGIGVKISYFFHMFAQMYHMATSEVAVLDTYCILISCLKHKKNFKVIQMWHGLGCSKQFGYSVINKEEGSSYRLAQTMKMHKNYDWVLTSGEYCKQFFAEGFNISQEQILVAPLPKVDLLRDKQYATKIKEEIFSKHPECKAKETIVYSPTFRKDEVRQKQAIQDLIDGFDYSKYNLVLSLHPISNIVIDDKRVIIDKSFTSFQWAMAVDKVITDYSSSVYELSILNKAIYYYIYDYENYIDIRGMYTDPALFPGPKCHTVEQLLKEIKKKEYDYKPVKEFADLNIDPTIQNCTAHICDIILNYPKFTK